MRAPISTTTGGRVAAHRIGAASRPMVYQFPKTPLWRRILNPFGWTVNQLIGFLAMVAVILGIYAAATFW
jgi:hypothetical protein